MTNTSRFVLSLATLAVAAAGAGAQQPAFEWYSLHHPEVAAAAAAKNTAVLLARQSPPAQNTPSLAPGTFTTFDVPGAGAGFYAGTKPLAINGAGIITGTYQDASFLTHGFVRTTDGTITTIDAPGAVNGSYPAGIDDAGDIAGYYCDANFLCHGFWRTADGTYTSFDPSGSFAGTYVLGVDPAGNLTGYYWDKNYFARSFVRGTDGKIKTFVDPAAVNGTYSINISGGGFAGVYEDASYALHGFLGSRTTIATFDSPGPLEISAGIYSFATGIAVNQQGLVVGYYYDQPNFGDVRGFVRERSGKYTTFDAGPQTPCCLWTLPYAINDAGIITGSCNDDAGINHGFLRATDGAITILDAPGAGTGNIQGTASLSVNSKGVATGLYIDSNFVFHGFVYEP